MLTGEAISLIQSHLSQLNWWLLWHLLRSLKLHVIHQLLWGLLIVAALAGPSNPAGRYASAGHLLWYGHDLEGDTLLSALLILNRV